MGQRRVQSGCPEQLEALVLTAVVESSQPRHCFQPASGHPGSLPLQAFSVHSLEFGELMLEATQQTMTLKRDRTFVQTFSIHH